MTLPDKVRKSTSEDENGRLDGSFPIDHELSSKEQCETSEPEETAVPKPNDTTSSGPEHDGGSAVQNQTSSEQEATPTTPSEPEKLTGIQYYMVAACIIFGVFLVMLNASVVATAIPSITNYFGSIADIGWYGSAYLLANCTLQPLAGRIYTHQSLKYSYICFIGVFEVGNIICGAAVSSKMLIVGRAIAGAGSAGIVNGSLTIAAHAAPIEKRPMLVSFVANIARIGAVFGPLIGGVLSEDISWRWVFFINCPCGALCAILIFLVRMPPREDKENIRNDWRTFLASLDLRGFALFAPGCIMFLLALEWGGIQYAWNSATIIGLFCGSALMIAIFMTWEVHMGDRALIPIALLKVRTVWCGFFLQVLQFGCLFLLTYYLPIWFQTAKGASPINSGLMSLPSVLSQLFAGLAAAYAVQLIGYFTPFSIAGCITTAIGAGLMTTFHPWTGPNLWIGYQILMGSGRALAGQMALLAVQFAVPKSQVSLGTSVLTFAGNLGASIFVAAGQALFVNLLRPALVQYAPDVDPQTVINAGATNIQSFGNGANYSGIILAYNYALTRMFFLGCAASAASLPFCFGLGWGNIKKKKEKDKKEKEERQRTEKERKQEA